MKDLNKQPSEMTEVERWDAFAHIIAIGLVEAWHEGRLHTEPDIRMAA